MSIRYRCEPNLSLEILCTSTLVDIQNPKEKVYIFESKIIHKNGSYVHCYVHDGILWFERFGINNIDNIFPSIIQEHNVKIFDEFGLEYPNCY